MKNTSLIHRLLWFALPIMLLLGSGCPVGLDYPLGDLGTEKVDQRLVGTWRCMADSPEVGLVEIELQDETHFKVLVKEEGEMYSLETDNLVGFCTQFNGRDFVYFKPQGEEKFYHYTYSFNDDQLVVADVSLLDKGVDAVTSTAALRKEVAASMEKPEWGNELKIWEKE